jgi:photoactive yellow protein
MDHTSFQGVNLAELLPRIPDSIKNGLPFGLVKLDLKGTILEYNMAEGELTGVDPAWAIGKNFFDDVALCTKTQAFYGRFLEGVKKGFLNAVFDYTFDHRLEATRVRVHMVTVPDHLGRKTVMVLVKRTDKPVVIDAFAEALPARAVAASAAAIAPVTAPVAAPVVAPVTASVPQRVAPAAPIAAAPAPAAAPSIEDIVRAVVATLNQTTLPVAAPPTSVAAPAAAAPAQAATPAPAAAAPPTAPPATGSSRHEDIFKF